MGRETPSAKCILKGTHYSTRPRPLPPTPLSRPLGSNHLKYYHAYPSGSGTNHYSTIQGPKWSYAKAIGTTVYLSKLSITPGCRWTCSAGNGFSNLPILRFFTHTQFCTGKCLDLVQIPIVSKFLDPTTLWENRRMQVWRWWCAFFCLRHFFIFCE